MKSPPLVSVVIPAYNHEEYVEQAIRSVLEQTYSPIELVVVDDGSTDGTWERIETVRHATGNAFAAFRKPNGGVSESLNFGIERTKGDYVAVLASDDYFLPDKIALQMQEFSTVSEDVALVHTSAYTDYGDGDLVELTGLYHPAQGRCFAELLADEVQVVAPSVLFRRAAFEAVGRFDEQLRTEDVDFYVRLTWNGYGLHYLPKPLLVKRMTDRNLGGDVEANYASHIATLEKFRGEIDQERFRHTRGRLLLSKGRNAAGQNDLRKSYHAYREACAVLGNPAPLLEWGLRASRSIVLSAMPSRLRAALRRLRRAVTAAGGNRFLNWR